MRRALPSDRDELFALGVEAHGGDEAFGLRSVWDDPTAGPAHHLVVTDAGRIVSTLCLLAQTWRIGGADGVDVPVGQIEFVATAPSHRRRGLVAALFDSVHGLSDARGDLLRVIWGIPYFYRRFGYGHGLVHPPNRAVPPGLGPVPEGWTIREPTVDDLPAMAEHHRRAQEAAGVALLRTDWEWRRLLTEGPAEGHRHLVAERECGVEGQVRLSVDGDEGLAHELAGSAEAADALLAHLSDVEPARVRIFERPGTPAGERIEARCTEPQPPRSKYVQVPDPVALLDRLRPVLSARLAAGGPDELPERLTLTWYAASAVLVLRGREVAAVEPADGIEDPSEVPATVGLPPDALPRLVLGRDDPAGFAGLDDVRVGGHGALLATLFPAVAHDWYTAT